MRYGGFEFGVGNPLANRNFTVAEEVADRWLKVGGNLWQFFFGPNDF